jgi:hypothetical protein
MARAATKRRTPKPRAARDRDLRAFVAQEFREAQRRHKKPPAAAPVPSVERQTNRPHEEEP